MEKQSDPTKTFQEQTSQKKKTYQKPLIFSESMFESAALESAGKTYDEIGLEEACTIHPGTS